MDNSLSDDELEDLARVLPVRPEGPTASERKTDFKPWHRPRKQYVRSQQWAASIGQLAEEAHFPSDSRVFRYLTLPSEDMLDIRVLHDTLSAKHLKLKYLGFVSVMPGNSTDIRMNLSENEIKGLPGIEDTSEIVRDLFQSIASPKSVGHDKVSDHGPFHAVNIDLCDHFTKGRTSAPLVVDAIQKISEIQLSRGADDWLLFLTTRVNIQNVGTQYLKAFQNAITQNVEVSKSFGEELARCFDSCGDEEVSDYIQNAEEMVASDFRTFYCVGLGKWLLKLLLSSIPSVTVEMLQSHSYSVVVDQRDMLSLAYRCRRITKPPVDRFRLVDQGKVKGTEQIDEVELGVSIVRSTKRLSDLDTMLANDTELRTQMITESEYYLEFAGYDISEYGAFLEKFGDQVDKQDVPIQKDARSD